MSAYELNGINGGKIENFNVKGFEDTNDTNYNDGFGSSGGGGFVCKEVIDEPIIAFKIYDSCRQQDCCTYRDLGPVRAVETKIIDGTEIKEGDVIVPPQSVASVSIKDLTIVDTIIVSKKPSPFKKGYWDIELKYVFEFELELRGTGGSVIDTIKATNIYNKKLCLFGSSGTDLVLSTDLFSTSTNKLEADPFVIIESKAVPLSAEIVYVKNKATCESTSEIRITIGLFSIIKLFRIVDLLVDSKGFAIPNEANAVFPVNPCDFFDELDFPMDIFAPPQKPEFLAGISSNIPSTGIKDRNIDEHECTCNDNYRYNNCDYAYDYDCNNNYKNDPSYGAGF